MSERYFTPDDLEAFPELTEPQALARCFAGYLARYRQERCGVYLPCEISDLPPDTSPDYVRLPHLVAFQEHRTTVRDVIMWERLPRIRAEQWLGTALPDQQLIEDHLPDLKKLRVQIRENRLLGEEYAELRGRLTGRYLSILFVYQNIDIFKDLW